MWLSYIDPRNLGDRCWGSLPLDIYGGQPREPIMGSDDVISPSEGCEDIIAFVPSITILPTISHAMVSANCYKKSGVK